MQLTVNGKSSHYEGIQTIADLLRLLSLEGKPVVVEHNFEALLPAEAGAVILKEGDNLEIVQITAGG